MYERLPVEPHTHKVQGRQEHHFFAVDSQGITNKVFSHSDNVVLFQEPGEGSQFIFPTGTEVFQPSPDRLYDVDAQRWYQSADGQPIGYRFEDKEEGYDQPR